MGKQNNRTCIICGEKYHYCPNCSEDSKKPTWYFIFNNQNCHDIYEVCTAYLDEEISIKEAYEKISKLDLSNLENFYEPTKLQIQEILDYKKVKNTTQTETVLSKTNSVKK